MTEPTTPVPASHSHALRCLLRLAALFIVLTGATGRSAEPEDEFTRAVAQYELTLPHLEAYGKAMTGLADWAKANPAKAAAMKQRTPKGPTSFKATLAQLESEPAIAEQLKKQKLTGRDFVVIPLVVMQAQIAAMGEAQGRVFPADRINPKNTALVRAHEARVNALMTTATADRVRAFGR